MASVYIRMAGADQDEAFLKAMGREVEPAESEEAPALCARCENWNEAGVEFCQVCHFPLTDEAVLRLERQRMEEREELEVLVDVRIERVLRLKELVAELPQSQKEVVDRTIVKPLRETRLKGRVRGDGEEPEWCQLCGEEIYYDQSEWFHANTDEEPLGQSRSEGRRVRHPLVSSFPRRESQGASTPRD